MDIFVKQNHSKYIEKTTFILETVYKNGRRPSRHENSGNSGVDPA